MFNIKLPMTDADEAALTGDLDSLLAKLTAFKPGDEAAANLLHIKPEDLETLELMLAYAVAHPTELPGSIDLTAFGQVVDLAKRATAFAARMQEDVDLVNLIALVARNYSYQTSREIYRIEQAKGRNDVNATILDSFGKRFAKAPQAKKPTPPQP